MNIPEKAEWVNFGDMSRRRLVTGREAILTIR